MSGGRCSVGCKAGLPGLKGLVGLSVFRYVPRGKVRSLCPWDLQEDAQDTSASHEQYPGFRLWNSETDAFNAEPQTQAVSVSGSPRQGHMRV